MKRIGMNKLRSAAVCLRQTFFVMRMKLYKNTASAQIRVDAAAPAAA